MVHHIRNTWEQIRKKSRWGYAPLGIAIGLSYIRARGFFIAQEPTVWITESNLTANMVLLFALWGGSCPIIAKRLGKPRLFGYIIMAPILLILIFFLSLFGMETRW